MELSIYSAVEENAKIAGRQVGSVVLTAATIAGEQGLNAVLAGEVYGTERGRRDAAISCLYILADVYVLFLSGAVKLSSCGYAAQHDDDSDDGRFHCLYLSFKLKSRCLKVCPELTKVMPAEGW